MMIATVRFTIERLRVTGSCLVDQAIPTRILPKARISNGRLEFSIAVARAIHISQVLLSLQVRTATTEAGPNRRCVGKPQAPCRP